MADRVALPALLEDQAAGRVQPVTAFVSSPIDDLADLRGRCNQSRMANDSASDSASANS